MRSVVSRSWARMLAMTYWKPAAMTTGLARVCNGVKGRVRWTRLLWMNLAGRVLAPVQRTKDTNRVVGDCVKDEVLFDGKVPASGK